MRVNNLEESHGSLIRLIALTHPTRTEKSYRTHLLTRKRAWMIRGLTNLCPRPRPRAEMRTRMKMTMTIPSWKSYSEKIRRRRHPLRTKISPVQNPCRIPKREGGRCTEVTTPQQETYPFLCSHAGRCDCRSCIWTLSGKPYNLFPPPPVPKPRPTGSSRRTICPIWTPFAFSPMP